MTHLDAAAHQQVACLLAQLQQAQQVRHGCTRAADRSGRLLVGQFELLDQAFQSQRLLQRVQILTLYVLDQRQCDRMLVRHVPDNGRDLVQARHLGRAPASLSGDDLVSLDAEIGLAHPAHDDRLHDTLGTDGRRQILQRLLAHVDARLVAAALEQVHRDLLHGFAGRRAMGFKDRCAEQGVETAPQTFLRHGMNPDGDRKED